MGTTIVVPQYVTSITELSAVKLARYAQLVGYDENPFWGIAHNVGDHPCKYIWLLEDRAMVAKYLYEAQMEIEQEINYLIGKQWTTEYKKAYRCPMLTKYGYVDAFGIQHIDTIANGSTVDHSADPCVIGPIATTVTDTSEIAIYHPGTTIEITPGSITIAGGNVTITIPMCRLVMPSHADNPEVGYDYSTYGTDWGEHTVDVKRRWNDTSTQAILSTNHKCSLACSNSGCTGYTQSACGYVKNPRLGVIEVYPADYVNGCWIKKSCSCSGYDEAQMNYLSGVDLNPQLEDMIIRLAHSKMPSEPCGCDPLRQLWDRDRKVPEAMSVQQAACPFGQSNGAYTTWLFARAIKLVRGGIVA